MKENNKLLHSRGFNYSNLILINSIDNGDDFRINYEKLTKGTANIVDPSISQTGDYIVYSKQKKGNIYEIYMISIDGNYERQF